ncbi:hypothetical protein ASG52_12580 [Methylobacterium sp. Leaf456]|uniref:hypothetical protein n=1 Tax=Methylobacterium sp. Leaf456 TaxID=1736382 RepID=UPI0007006F03|nr:hypothetical protein [Methylobacterium sp. Leaf456]KQT46835.1 hypothetical protein ASG52_12580 [Methylobacterium sp. Leaf456]
MKGQDVVVLLKLVSLQDSANGRRSQDLVSNLQGGAAYSVRNLESLLGISKTEIGASIKRLLSIGMAIKDRETGWPKPHRRDLYSFIVHGLKFVFPAEPGALTRGIPTAFAAPMLTNMLISGGTYIYVWPSATGRDIGQSILPLFRSVPEAAAKDDRLYEYLALVDAVRLGNQREVSLARDKLADRLMSK